LSNFFVHNVCQKSLDLGTACSSCR